MVNKSFASSSVSFKLDSDKASITGHNPDAVLAISLKRPVLVLDDLAPTESVAPMRIEGDIASGDAVRVDYPVIALPDGAEIDLTVFVQWSRGEGVLRKWATLSIIGPKPLLLKEVILDRLEPGDKPFVYNPAAPQSYPLFLDGAFAGIEYPVASSRLEDGIAVLAHKPGRMLASGTTYETRKAVYGVVPKGMERQAFMRYIESHRPAPHDLHFNYNSWWTSSVPFSEKDILALMKTFEENLFKPYGVSFDTFAIDLGWSEKEAIWEINRGSSLMGLSFIQKGAASMDSRLGLWTSPTNCYTPWAFDNEWAQANGYETLTLPAWNGGIQRYTCLGGEKYANAFRDRLSGLIADFGIRHIKLDGYVLTCPETTHGHEPGELSSETIAEGGIRAFEAMRQADPDVWLETTCFGYNPSPWWLFYVNSVIGTFGDDAPCGRVPCPVYRESYTTGRDYFNLQGAARLPIPITAQEVLGVIHQSDESFVNDAVMTIMRGHAFVPFYVNPKFMNEERWKQLAGVMKWARANESILSNTQPILPLAWRGGNAPEFTGDAEMPRDPYGYAHWNWTEEGKGKPQGLVALRNTWIAKQSVTVNLDDATGMPDNTAPVNVISIYPKRRIYGRGLKKGDALKVPLGAYETVVLAFSHDEPEAGVPDYSENAGCITGRIVSTSIKRIAYEALTETMGPDWMSEIGAATTAYEMQMHGHVTIGNAPQARLLVLLEGDKTQSISKYHLTINGQPVAMTLNSSGGGWSATIMKSKEHWLFMEAPLAQGSNEIHMMCSAGDETQRISAWVWATQPGEPADGKSLPEPELISLDSFALLAPIEVASIIGEEKAEVPVKRINGIYMDTIEPVSVTQGWGTLQKNQNLNEKPLMIGNRRYLRGLGTHAVARIAYELDGTMKTFESIVGVDGGSNGTVIFEVLADGRKVWESGLMRCQDPAREVSADITGARTLELIVGDGGNGISGCNADWAEARLLR